MATALVDLYGGELPFDRLILTEGYRPSDSEEFMCDKHRAYFLRKLKDWKDAVIEESRATMAQLQVDSLREPDLADRASSVMVAIGRASKRASEIGSPVTSQ